MEKIRYSESCACKCIHQCGDGNGQIPDTNPKGVLFAGSVVDLDIHVYIKMILMDKFQILVPRVYFLREMWLI